jgi:hypothetical protein
MSKLKLNIAMVVLLLVSIFAITGCGGGSNAAPRIMGLAPDGVVKTVFDNVKADRMNDAKEYLAPNTLGDKTVIQEMKNSNLLFVKTVAQKGDYAVVLATLQQQNSNLSVKPVGLEKINGEWYVLDVNNIYNNAKYSILQRLLTNI